jgi:hypothetical protein
MVWLISLEHGCLRLKEPQQLLLQQIQRHLVEDERMKVMADLRMLNSVVMMVMIVSCRVLGKWGVTKKNIHNHV